MSPTNDALISSPAATLARSHAASARRRSTSRERLGRSTGSHASRSPGSTRANTSCRNRPASPGVRAGAASSQSGSVSDGAPPACRPLANSSPRRYGVS
ncbi:hypothetical protein DO71_6114 [Burkholderia pseudomallei]|nr:hypothetical protein DO71_6114 [Burkholderia pseudomallei]